MPKTIAWALVAMSAILVYNLAFTPYDHALARWQATEEGGLLRVSVPCPSPWEVIVHDAEPEQFRDRGECELSSRSLLIEAVLVALAALLLTWHAITRGRPTAIGPISSKIGPITRSRD